MKGLAGALRGGSASRARAGRATIAALALVGLAAFGATGAIAAPAADGVPVPNKGMCGGKQFKIGYDVFSGTQPFANLVTKGLMDAAKKLGCVQIVKTIDNLNGPVAVGNLKTLINQDIDGFIDFQVLAPYQPAISKELKKAKIPGVAIVGADLPGSPSVGADNYGAAVKTGQYLGLIAKKRFPSQVPYAVVA